MINDLAKQSQTGLAEQVNYGDDYFAQLKKRMESAREFAIYIKESSWGKAFETKNEAGKIEIKENDIIACIMLGFELGMNPMSSVLYGKSLNIEGYTAIKRGRSLGLDDSTSMNNIYVWKNKEGKFIVYTGIHILVKVLVEAKVIIEVLKDAEPIYGYYNATKTNVFISDSLRPNMFLVTPATSPAELTQAVADKKELVVRRKSDTITTIKFDRPSTGQVITISYTLQQATNAGLYKGLNEEGEQVSGKSNWNNHPETHLRNRCLSIGARIIVADKLHGTLSQDEAQEIGANTIVDDDDAKVLESIKMSKSE